MNNNFKIMRNKRIKQRKTIRISLIVLMGLVAIATLFLTLSIFFDWYGIKEKQGNYVQMIVLANFISAVFYLIALGGLLFWEKWVSKVLLVNLIFLVGGFIGLFLHIYLGGLYEEKTIGAMIFRISFAAVFWGASLLIGRKPKKKYSNIV